MRKLIASINITLDGFMADADSGLDWHIAYWNDELSDNLCCMLSEADTILLGANTYKAFAAYWPEKANDLLMPRGDIALTEVMNKYTKVVVSKTIAKASWSNSLLIDSNVRLAIEQLKNQRGKALVILGSRQLLQSLVKMNLIDRFELWVYPITICRGERLFDHARPTLRLIDHRAFSSGVLCLSYQNT